MALWVGGERGRKEEKARGCKAETKGRCGDMMALSVSAYILWIRGTGRLGETAERHREAALQRQRTETLTSNHDPL